MQPVRGTHTSKAAPGPSLFPIPARRSANLVTIGSNLPDGASITRVVLKNVDREKPGGAQVSRFSRPGIPQTRHAWAVLGVISPFRVLGHFLKKQNVNAAKFG